MSENIPVTVGGSLPALGHCLPCKEMSSITLSPSMVPLVVHGRQRGTCMLGMRARSVSHCAMVNWMKAECGRDELHL